jgi:hypothetical protein
MGEVLPARRLHKVVAVLNDHPLVVGWRRGFSWEAFVQGQDRCHVSVMTKEAPGAQPITPFYRLVVMGSHLKGKQFVWVIVDDNHRNIPVQTSKQTFRSMEGAYNAGRGALEYWQRKTRHTHPPVDLAQPPEAEKSADRATVRRGALTSSIYARG